MGVRTKADHVGELRDKGFEVTAEGPSVPIVGLRCEHPADKMRVTVRGKTAMMLRCLACGRTGPFVPIPERPLKSDETDLLVALAREASWRGRVA